MYLRGGLDKPKPLNISDLPCPSKSLIDAQNSADQMGYMLPARPKYAPIIAPPPFLQNLEPAWKGCTTQIAFDPPKTLTPASVMVPSPTYADPAELESTPAVPRPTVAKLPDQTQPGHQSVTLEPPISPSRTAEAFDPKYPSSVNSQRPSNIPDDPPDPLASYNVADPGKLADPDGFAESHDIPPNINPGTIADVSNSDTDPSIRTTTPQDNIALQSLSPDDAFTKDHSLPVVVIMSPARGQSDEPHGSGYSTAGNSVQSNDPAVTFPPSPGPHGNLVLVIGSSITLLPTGSAGSVRAAAGVELTLFDHDRNIVDGKTLSPDGQVVTVSGIPIYMTLNDLVLDGQVSPSPTSAWGAAPNTVIVNGNSLTVGGPAMTTSGTQLALVSGNTGLLAEIGKALSSLSIAVTAGGTMTGNAAGTLEADGGGEYTVAAVNDGDLGSLILLGFGHPGGTSTASMAIATDITAGASNPSSPGVVEFTGGGHKTPSPQLLYTFCLTVFAGMFAV